MNFQAVSEIGGFLVIILGLLYNFAYSKGRQDKLEESTGDALDEFKRQLGLLWTWKDKHEHEAEEWRRHYDKELTEQRVMAERASAKDEEILRRLTSIETLVREELNTLRTELKQKLDR